MEKAQSPAQLNPLLVRNVTHPPTNPAAPACKMRICVGLMCGGFLPWFLTGIGREIKIMRFPQIPEELHINFGFTRQVSGIFLNAIEIPDEYSNTRDINRADIIHSRW